MAEKNGSMYLIVIVMMVSAVMIVVFPTMLGGMMVSMGETATQLVEPTETVETETTSETTSESGGIIVWVLIIGAITYMGVVILLGIVLAYKGVEEEEDEHLITNIRYNGKLRPMKLRDINRIVVVGEDTKLGKLGSIRRMHALLHAKRDGELFITENIRHLSSEEGFKKGLCKDVALTESEWESVKNAYSKISEELQLRYTIKKSNEAIEENRKKLIKEQELKKAQIEKQDKFIRGYLLENGEQQLPTQLMKESKRLENDLKQLSEELDNLGKEYKHISGEYYDTLEGNRTAV